MSSDLELCPNCQTPFRYRTSHCTIPITSSVFYYDAGYKYERKGWCITCQKFIVIEKVN